MNRKAITFAVILTTLMFSGCARNASQNANNSSGSSAGIFGESQTSQNQTTTQGASHTTEQGTQSQSNMSEQSGTQESVNTQSNTGEQEMLSEEEARQIALTHANMTADQVTFTKSKLDQDDDGTHYDIEFHTKDNIEYDYEINPYTGEVLDYDRDIEND